MKLGWAAGRVLAKKGSGPVLVGKDTRISGYMFESALEAGLSAAGVDIRLLGPMPTPGIAYLTKSTRAQAGIVISASHNPFHDNGIKFFAGDGTKLADEVEMEIEYEKSEIIDKINSFFGYNCISNIVLKIVQEKIEKNKIYKLVDYLLQIDNF